MKTLAKSLYPENSLGLLRFKFLTTHARQTAFKKQTGQLAVFYVRDLGGDVDVAAAWCRELTRVDVSHTANQRLHVSFVVSFNTQLRQVYQNTS